MGLNVWACANDEKAAESRTHITTHASGLLPTVYPSFYSALSKRDSASIHVGGCACHRIRLQVLYTVVHDVR